MTKQIKWNGDFANSPKAGVAIFGANGMVQISWNDGSKMIVPDFTIKPQYGWTVSDA